MAKIIKGYKFLDKNNKAWTFVRAYLNENDELYMILSDGYVDRHVHADEFDREFERVK